MRAKFKEIVPEFFLDAPPAAPPSTVETLPVISDQKDTPTVLKRDKETSMAR
jgi:hypothetical protein